jgi:CBS domain-containing protein
LQISMFEQRRPTMALVGEVMTRYVVAVAPDTCVADALAVASEHGVDYLPVLDGEEVVGMICLPDLDDERLDIDIGAVMHSPVITIAAGASLEDAVARMDRHGISCLLVTAGGLVSGVLTRGDLVRAGLPEDDVIGPRRCSACGTHRHVRQRERDKLYLFADCLDRTDVRGREDELGVGD